MKATIDKLGTLRIQAETPLESYARASGRTKTSRQMTRSPNGQPDRWSSTLVFRPTSLLKEAQMSSGEQEALRLAKGLRDGTLLLSERDEAAEWLERLHAEREADRAAMREALEALENGRRVRNCEGGTKYQPPLEDAAISSLKARTQ